MSPPSHLDPGPPQMTDFCFVHQKIFCQHQMKVRECSREMASFQPGKRTCSQEHGWHGAGHRCSAFAGTFVLLPAPEGFALHIFFPLSLPANKIFLWTI